MKVNTEGLLELAERLDPVIDRMLDLERRLRRVEYRILEISALEQLSPAIERKCIQTANQTLDLIHLQQALDEIARRYAAKETELTDRAGQDLVVYRRLPTGYIPLPNLWLEGSHPSILLDQRPWTAPRSRGRVRWYALVGEMHLPHIPVPGPVVVRWAAILTVGGLE